MIIDLLFAVIMVMALIQGYRRGFIVAVFSFLAIIIGVAAALKLSAVVAEHIGNSVNISNRWLPVLSFFLVFVVIVLLVRLGARAIQRLTETLLLGWLNRLGGIILYVLLYTTVFSIVLFFATQVNLIKPATIKSSVTYGFIKPWGPWAIDALGSIIPFFRNMFAELEQFFTGVSKKI
jgi:membrane protein required for colicin V production